MPVEGWFRESWHPLHRNNQVLVFNTASESSPASFDIVLATLSGCCSGRAWRIGGLVMETPILPAIRALQITQKPERFG